MPTYEYKCDACGHAFEKFQSMSAAHLRTCPHCGKKKLRRLIGTGAGLIFKGSGFYITDYRSDNYQNAAKADSGAASTSSPAQPAVAAASDAKPATVSESATSKPASKPKAPTKSAAKAEATTTSR